MFYFIACTSTPEEATAHKIPENKPVISESTKANSSKFSDYMGAMKWESAREKCASLKMRLPTIDELAKAHAEKVTESWKKDGTFYWTSEQSSDGSAYYFYIHLGTNEVLLKGYNLLVRCIRL
jgi:hypothetical protein